jgi:hypothetical protein
MFWFGVMAIVIIPKKVKYKKVKKVKKKFQRNLVTVLSYPIMLYTIPPYMIA